MAMTHGMLPLMPKQQSRSASIAKAKKDSLDRTRSEQNVATVLLGSADGLIFRNKINEKFTKAVISALALVTILLDSAVRWIQQISCVSLSVWHLGRSSVSWFVLKTVARVLEILLRKSSSKGKNGESFHRGLRYRMYRFLRWFDDDHGIIWGGH